MTVNIKDKYIPPKLEVIFLFKLKSQTVISSSTKLLKQKKVLQKQDLKFK